jgi:hypothetical protein
MFALWISMLTLVSETAYGDRHSSAKLGESMVGRIRRAAAGGHAGRQLAPARSTRTKSVSNGARARLGTTCAARFAAPRRTRDFTPPPAQVALRRAPTALLPGGEEQWL